MPNTKRIEWAREQRLRAIRKRQALVGKPIAFPTPEPVAKPVIVPVVERKVPGPKPERLVDYRKPYLKRKGEWICELCNYVLKTEAGIIAHIRAKHPEVTL